MANVTVEDIEQHLNEAKPNWKTEHHEEYEYPLTVSIISKDNSWVDDEFYDIQMWGSDLVIAAEGASPRKRYRNVRSSKEAVQKVIRFVKTRQISENE